MSNSLPVRQRQLWKMYKNLLTNHRRACYAMGKGTTSEKKKSHTKAEFQKTLQKLDSFVLLQISLQEIARKQLQETKK